MSLYNLGQIRQQVAQESAIQDENGDYEFSSTTFPSKDLVNTYINQAIMEVTSPWDYGFLQTSKSYPFKHVISGVQGVYLSGYSVTDTGVRTIGELTPYPFDVLNYSWRANNQIDMSNANFSGLSFTGVHSTGSGYSSVSTYGYPTYNNNLTTVGYTYQLDNDIDKILACIISNSNSGQTAKGILLTSVQWHDIERTIPIGIIASSGTPIYYSEFPGLGPITNKTIQFFPTPTPIYSGESFIIHYKKRHTDLVNDSDLQQVIPEQFQRIITNATLEKVFDLLDNPKASLATQRRMNLESKMKVWDANQPNAINRWRDFNYENMTSRLYDNSQLVTIPYY